MRVDAAQQITAADLIAAGLSPFNPEAAALRPACGTFKAATNGW